MAASELLGKLLTAATGPTTVVGRIVETEAYTADDEASHSFRGETPRNRVMFGPPGRLYVYRSYGLHWCANVVTGAAGDAQAVLLRAVELVDGIDVARERRGGRADRDLTNGPGKLCQALGIDGRHDGVDLTASASPIRIVDDGTPPPSVPLVGPRVGITKAVDVPWRFRIPR